MWMPKRVMMFNTCADLNKFLEENKDATYNGNIEEVPDEYGAEAFNQILSEMFDLRCSIYETLLKLDAIKKALAD